MTTLGLATAMPPEGDPVGPLLSRIKWSVVAPWLVTAAMFGANGYHRFLSGEQARESDAKTIVELKTEVAGVKSEVSELKTEVGILKAIMIRMEAQQSADILRNSRRGSR